MNPQEVIHSFVKATSLRASLAVTSVKLEAIQSVVEVLAGPGEDLGREFNEFAASIDQLVDQLQEFTQLVDQVEESQQGTIW